MQMLFAVLFAFVLACHLPASAQLSAQTTIFQGGSFTHATRPIVRLPALVATNSPGVLLAFCEARYSSDDTSDKEIVYASSFDYGATWTLPQVLAEDPDPNRPTGNASPVLDASNGKLLVLYGSSAQGKGEKALDNIPKLYMRSSTTLGTTWNPPVELSALIPPDVTLMLPGPGHGIQLQNGSHAGTLLTPVWGYRKLPNGDGTFRLREFTSVLISEDHGATWDLGGMEDASDAEAYGPNESQVVEQGNGNILKITRAAKPVAISSPDTPLVRVKSISTDGGQSFSRQVPSAQFSGPRVEGAVLRASPSLLAFTSPTKDATNYTSSGSRADLAIRYSEDDGITWKYPIALPNGKAEYTDIAKLNATTLGVIAELQTSSGDNTQIKFFTTTLPAADSSSVTDASGHNPAVRWVKKVSSSSTTGSGRFNTATWLNGSAYVHAPDASPSLLTNNSFTLNLWFKSGNYSNASESLMTAYGMGNTSPYHMSLRLDPAKGLRMTSTQYPALAQKVYEDNNATIVNDNQWHMVSAVRSGTSLLFYVDGALRSTQTGFFANNYTTATATDFGLVFGARPTNGTNGYTEQFNGALDDVQVHHRALSASEISGLFNNVQPGDLTALRLSIL